MSTGNLLGMQFIPSVEFMTKTVRTSSDHSVK